MHHAPVCEHVLKRPQTPAHPLSRLPQWQESCAQGTPMRIHPPCSQRRQGSGSERTAASSSADIRSHFLSLPDEAGGGKTPAQQSAGRAACTLTPLVADPPLHAYATPAPLKTPQFVPISKSGLPTSTPASPAANSWPIVVGGSGLTATAPASSAPAAPSIPVPILMEPSKRQVDHRRPAQRAGSVELLLARGLLSLLQLQACNQRHPQAAFDADSISLWGSAAAGFFLSGTLLWLEQWLRQLRILRPGMPARVPWPVPVAHSSSSLMLMLRASSASCSRSILQMMLHATLLPTACAQPFADPRRRRGEQVTLPATKYGAYSSIAVTVMLRLLWASLGCLTMIRTLRIAAAVAWAG